MVVPRQQGRPAESVYAGLCLDIKAFTFLTLF